MGGGGGGGLNILDRSIKVNDMEGVFVLLPVKKAQKTNIQRFPSFIINIIAYV